MNGILLVALGGAIGAVLRYGSVHTAARAFGLGAPVGIALVNIAGSFLMGLAAVWFLERFDQAKFAPLVMSGILGGFTTFSAFSLDAVLLWEQGRSVIALVYVLGSVIGAILAVIAGMMVMRGAMS
jgi:CrcB protein